MQLSLDVAMEHTFSVAEFSELLGDVLTHTFPHDVWVQGEVRGITRAQSGHVYFDLVDVTPEPGRQPHALLPVVLFEGTRKLVNAQIKRSGGGMRIDDGVAVRIRAMPNFYAPQGKLSLRMTGVDPAYTLGQLAASRDRLLRQLAEEGLLERNRSVPLPLLPLRVGLVTAAGSAAEADFLAELRSASMSFELLRVATPVQGRGAAARIAAAIELCTARRADVIAMVRGGGAKTDLVAFDDEVVARAIAACPVPVLTGIGHEIDQAVADHVAHTSFKTPTACAAHLVEVAALAERRAHDVWEAIEAAAARVVGEQQGRVGAAAQTTRVRATERLRTVDERMVRTALRARELTNTGLDRAAGRLDQHVTSVSLRARHRLRHATDTNERATRTLERTGRARVATAGQFVDRAEERARLLDPARALARGWTITTDHTGQVVRSVTDVAAGTSITTRVGDGIVISTVNETERRDAEEGP